MANDTKFFEALIQKIKKSIHVTVPAKVTAVHGATADIKPLFKDNGEEHTLVLDAHILEHVEYQAPLAVGDIVYVSFADYALDYLSSEPFDPQFSRMHSMNDAVIVGRFKK
ncbi:hypothetical protein [Priestia megaterium]|uniref:hypothetical protein n=1 Tax=Priestia megaterium TaxID=1404 RepID=UPI000BF856B1|nr:hypothetical protein [Priestia megaterium]PFR93527.1 hypothetical protein COK39_17710 [Priestia megaterium]